MPVTVAAVADVHSPKYLAEFARALGEMRGEPDLLIMAGDMIFRGMVDEYSKVLNAIRLRTPCPIIGIFGNEEFEHLADEIRGRFDQVTWVDDEYIEVEIRGMRIGIVGTRGCLDRPTRWQSRNIPNIAEVYSRRARRIEELLRNLKSDLKILVSHYGVTRLTLKGEEVWRWPFIASKSMELVMRRAELDMAIHGHVHKGMERDVRMGRTKVYNVSFPAVREVTLIEIKEKPSVLAEFF